MRKSTLSRLKLALALGAALTALPPVGARADSAAAAALPAPAAEKLPAVSVTRAQVREVVETAVVSGTLVPREEVMVSLEIDALAITELMAEEGDRVTKGQVLARLNRATLEAQLAANQAQMTRTDALASQARAQIAEAEANLRQSAADLGRTKALREGGWATGEKLDQRATAAQTAEARLGSARQALAVAQAEKAVLDAQRRELEVRLARTEIKAPKGGIVSRRTAKLGWVGSMVGEPMFRIIAEGEIELEAEVADVTLPRLKVGQKVAVTPAGFGESLAGTIRLISPEVDKATRLGRMRIAIAAPTGQMLPVGAFGRGQVELGRRSGVTLPQSAITWGKENGRDVTTVQVVADGRVATRPVTLGLAGNGRIEIAAGLTAGETVVARAGAFLRDGDRVLAVAEEARP